MAPVLERDIWFCGHCRNGPMSLRFDFACVYCYNRKDVYSWTEISTGGPEIEMAEAIPNYQPSMECIEKSQDDSILNTQPFVENVKKSQDESIQNTQPSMESNKKPRDDPFQNIPPLMEDNGGSQEEYSQNTGPFTENINLSIMKEALASEDVHLLKQFLAKNFPQVAQDEYSWLIELDAMGYSMGDIAELLCEQANDSPWIFFELTTSARSEINNDFHVPNCAHQKRKNTARPLVPIGMFSQSEDKNIPSSNRITENLIRALSEFCGLAGIAPISRDLSTWNGKATFCAGNSTSYITYGPLGENDVDKHNLAFRILAALQGFCKAVSHVQEANCCCDCFTILRLVIRNRHPNVVEMVRVDFGLACQLLSKLQNLLSSNEIDNSQLWTCGMTAIKTLSVLGISYEINSKEDVKQKKRESVEGDETSEMLHLCSLAVQFLCLGFFSYSQAHCGTMQPFFLDTPQKKVVLQGSKEDPGDAWQIETQLVDLTCIGEMVQNSVIVFSTSNEQNSRRMLPENFKLDFLGFPEDMIDTWGPGEFIGKASKASDNLLFAIGLGGGIITVANSEDQKFHWSRNAIRDTDTLRHFEPDTKLLVGATVTFNDTCPMDEGQFWLNSEECLENLGVFEGYWEAAERQAGIQTGQYINLAYFQTWAKIPATTIKKVQLALPDNHLLPFLQSNWGLQVSCCTGIGRRVSLCELIADVMPAFVDSLFPIPKLWESLKQDHNIIQAFQSNDLQQWLGNLDDECQQLVAVIIRYILSVLTYTGVDSKGENFRIAWVRKNKPFQCFKLSCQKKNYWARILADSGDCATFAYVTSKCLETVSLKCRGSIAMWHNESILLETAVCRHISDQTVPNFSSTPWILKHKDRYSMGKLNSPLLVTVDRENLNINPRLLVNPSKIPTAVAIRLSSKRFFKPLQPLQRLRERQSRDGQAETVVVLTAELA